MKQGLVVPRDFIEITRARLKAGHIYCSQCMADLERKRRWAARQAGKAKFDFGKKIEYC